MRSALGLSFICLQLLLGVYATPLELENRASCNNNCARAVIASAFPKRPVSADCSSFLVYTITPSASTTTITTTSSQTVQTTSTITSTSVVLTTTTDVSTITSVSTDVDTTTTTVPVTVTENPLLKRASPSIPAYASPCSNAAAYSSACACIGVTRYAVTAATLTSTFVVSTSQTSVQTSLTTSTFLTTSTVTELTTTTKPTTTTTTTTAQATSTTFNSISYTRKSGPNYSPPGCVYNSYYSYIFAPNDDAPAGTFANAINFCRSVCDSNPTCRVFEYYKSDPAFRNQGDDSAYCILDNQPYSADYVQCNVPFVQFYVIYEKN